MRYPNIHSISTVGMLRHYNQDFLIHETRTDFIGNNGTGKSIIADLLQLIFIPDTDKFSFGTDSKDRRLSALPFNIAEAYAFLNIEVLQDTYITIGVRIASNANESMPVRPFIVLNAEDPDKPLSDIGIRKSQLLYSKHFTNDGKVPLLKDMVKHIRDNYGLTLLYYSNRSEKEQYYHFLFKHILPINLALESNLKTYANILQSFSRAKSLKTTDSKSLKSFLFEATNEIELEYKKKKEELIGLILSYRDMEALIQDLELKQQVLNELEEKDKLKSEAHYNYLKAKLTFVHQEVVQANKTYETEKEKLESTELEREKVKTRLEILKRSIPKVNSEIEILDKEIKILNECRVISDDLNGKKENLLRLKSIELPTVTYDFDDFKINIDEYSDEMMISSVLSLKKLIDKYENLKTIEAKCDEQRDFVEINKHQLKAEIQDHERVLEILNYKKEGTLFSEVIKASNELSEKQEVVLFHLISVYWNKPDHNLISTSVQYVEDLSILDEVDIIEDHHKGGYWLNLGKVKEYVPKPVNDKRLLDNPQRIEAALKEASEDIRSSISTKKRQLQELELFQKGAKVVLKNYNLDPDLDWKTVKTNAYLTSVFGNRKAKREREFDQLKSKLDELRKLISLSFDTDDLEELINNHTRQVDVKREEKTKLDREESEGKANLTYLEKDISNLTEGIVKKKDSLRDCELKLNELQENEIRKYFQELLLEPKSNKFLSINDLEIYKDKYDTEKQVYSTHYIKVSQQFKYEEHPEIAEQIADGGFSLFILEKVLLGSIGRKDQIAVELRECNSKRVNFESMIRRNIIDLFSRTSKEFDECVRKIRELNVFFKKHKISNQYTFKIDISYPESFDISWIRKLEEMGITLPNEIKFGDSISVDEVIESFFRSASGHKEKVKLADLLNPKTYFELSTKMTNDSGIENSGSTGETYTAVVLLGIGRLSVLSQKKEGLRFIILEEIANLDKTNFGTFPSIAEEFGYQIITMTPNPYGSDSDTGWYLHHLTKSSNNESLNSPDLVSYFKTNTKRTDLQSYLDRIG